MIKALAFGAGLYHTATTQPVLNGRERTSRYTFIPLIKDDYWVFLNVVSQHLTLPALTQSVGP